jgi:ASC-1-like (ASCH) protein
MRLGWESSPSNLEVGSAAFKVAHVDTFESAEHLLTEIGLEDTLAYRGIRTIEEGVAYINSLYKKPKPGARWLAIRLEVIEPVSG